jgi:hypothetical protein
MDLPNLLEAQTVNISVHTSRQWRSRPTIDQLDAALSPIAWSANLSGTSHLAIAVANYAIHKTVAITGDR